MNKNVKKLQLFAGMVKPEYRIFANQVVELYQEKRIPNIRTAENLIEKLSSRGAGPKTAVKKINAYQYKQSIIGRLSGKTQIKMYKIKCYLPITFLEKTLVDKADDKWNYVYEMRSKTIRKLVEYHKETSINIINDRIQEFAEEISQQEKHYDENEEFGDVEDLEITEIPKTELSDVKMGNQKYSHRALKNSEGLNVNEGQCVIDYILYELAGKPLFKLLNRDNLIDYFGGTLVSTKQIIDWARETKYVSVYAIDPLLNVFTKHVASDVRYTLCFLVNNNHLYPILNGDTKKSVVQSNRLTLDDYKFNISYEDSIEYIDDFTKKNPSINSKVVLFNDKKHENTLLEQLYKVTNDSKTMVDYIKFNNGKPTAFQHPLTNQVYEITTDFTERKAIVQQLAKKYGPALVKFQNQSYTQISTIIFDNEFGNSKQLKSNLSNKVFETLDKYKIGPYCAVTTTDPKDLFEDDISFGFDICKSYSSVLLNNDTVYPIFQQFDEVKLYNPKQELLAGEYYINKQIKLCDGTMVYPQGFYPLNFTKYLLEKEIITKKNITHCIIAKQFLKADQFKEFVKHIYTTYEASEAKQLVNNFIGDLGTKYIKSDKGCITSSFEIACALLFQEKNNNNDIVIDQHNGLNFVRIKTKTPKYNTGLPLHRHIICGGIINLANLYYKIKTPQNMVVAFNTDSLMLKGTTPQDFTTTDSSSKNILQSIGSIRKEDWKIKGRHHDTFEDNDPYIHKKVEWNKQTEGDDFKLFCDTINKQSSAVIIGGPGCGKTEVIKSIRNPETDLILTFTNKAAENIISRCGDDKNICTFDTFFNDHLNYEQKIEKISKYERIITDEYSMSPVHMMNLLNQIKQQLNKKLLFFGDSNQCLAVDTNNIIYDYITTSTFSNMCDNNLFECTYKEQYSRYDKPLKEVLDTLLSTGKLKEFLNPVADKIMIVSGEKIVRVQRRGKTEIESYVNVCKSLKKKWEINDICIERFKKHNPKNKSIVLTLHKVISKKNDRNKISVY